MVTLGFLKIQDLVLDTVNQPIKLDYPPGHSLVCVISKAVQ